jgi:hypothetical protein
VQDTGPSLPVGLLCFTLTQLHGHACCTESPFPCDHRRTPNPTESELQYR